MVDFFVGEGNRQKRGGGVGGGDGGLFRRNMLLMRKGRTNNIAISLQILTLKYLFKFILGFHKVLRPSTKKHGMKLFC